MGDYDQPWKQSDGQPRSRARNRILRNRSSISWREAAFREYIKDPKAKMSGTNMAFPGLKDSEAN
jgi:cytochrome c2